MRTCGRTQTKVTKDSDYVIILLPRAPAVGSIECHKNQATNGAYKPNPTIICLLLLSINIMVHFHELSGLESFLQWLFMTRMSFYGVDLDLPWWFGLSSWHYAIYGVVMLLLEPKWAKESRFPYRTIAVLMIVLQGEGSYRASPCLFSDECSHTNLIYIQ